jgi:hypothetical protein
VGLGYRRGRVDFLAGERFNRVRHARPLSSTWTSRILVLAILIILVTWFNAVVAALRDSGRIYGLISHLLVLKALLLLLMVSVGARIYASGRLYFVLVLVLLWVRLLFCCMFLQSFLTPSLVLECRKTWLL